MISLLSLSTIRRLRQIPALIGGQWHGARTRTGDHRGDEEDGLTVIYRFVDEFPSQETRESFGWLTVISWKYDRTVRNGLPPEDTNKQMIALEQAIDGLEEAALCRHAYSRTGNGIRELVYYTSARDRFIGAFNDALSEHPRYPIEINFYEDREWEDFEKICGLFRRS